MDINKKQERVFIDFKTEPELQLPPKTKEELEEEEDKKAWFQQVVCDTEGLSLAEFYEIYGYK